ncbi:hypothetical protein TTHERM_00485910 (macronuclear) [Tetrahymena thermophila SB210]|uniref:Uncharacterized protein n=1 Tax=Tetrahymena thermophila (strain SB210) TaxID=312017 RepID=I7M6G1_TETTS|nr:hypothetical protein TTHERM_00485910 [Tetrahymena thermophila SB210]EAR85141.1 hypothetical protein TTHERM_00485910 [Tetrahymena thermophila SB210]|eukprot:XP_001032804.1 hypothetical protein TTHERM_00485910 [Tetrahymena thermophila SB210]
MKMNDGSPLKVTRLKRSSANNFNQENQQISVCQNINQKHQMMAQTIIEKIRCNSENLQQKQKRQTSSYAEQLAQYSLKNIIQQQINFQKNSQNGYADLSPTKQQNTSNCLNDSIIKKNNKRVIISALKLSIELSKSNEEDIEHVECETIVNEEFKKYKDMRTDSFSYNDHLVKEEIIKQLQATCAKKSGSQSPLRRQSNTLNTVIGQREIRSLQASRQLKEYLIKQQLTQSEIQEDDLLDIQKIDNLYDKQSPQFLQRSSFQKALNDLEEEIGQLNKNCRKRYERSRIQDNSKMNQETANQNTQYLSSEEGLDNQEIKIKAEQVKSNNQQQKISEKDDICYQNQNQENQIDNFDLKSESKEKCSPLWRSKICYSQKSQINSTRLNTDSQQYKIQKQNECSGNFAIFKNQYIKQMQSNISEKKNFTTSDSSYYMADADTDSSKQSSALSTKKNSCESEEIISASKDKQFPLNNNSLIFSQSQEIVDQQIITPKKQYCVQKLQDQLDISNQNQINQLNNKNSSNTPFSFGFNGFLSQQIYEGKKENTQEENKNQLRGRSLTPFQSSKIYQQDQSSRVIKSNEINLADQSTIELNQTSNQLNNQDKNNKSYLNQKSTQQQLLVNKSSFQQVKPKQATLEQIIMNEPRIKTESNIQRQRKRNFSAKEQSNSFTQRNEGANDLNEFRKKLLHKVMKNNIENRLSNQQQIGDNNNNIFQIRRIANQKQKSEYENQSSSINNSFLTNNYLQQTSQNMKLNVLNFENKDLKQKSDNKNISANIQANQEKLNNILKKKYKHVNNNKSNKNNVSLQNQILQDCHSKIFSAEDDISFFLKKLGTSPAASKINETNQIELNKSSLI